MFAIRRKNENKFLRGLNQPKLSSIIRTFNTIDDVDNYLVEIADASVFVEAANHNTKAHDALLNEELEVVELDITNIVRTIPRFGEEESME